MAVVSRSSSSGAAKASWRPETKRQRQTKIGEVSGPEALGAPGRVQGVADEDEGGHVQALGRRHGAHAPAKGTAANRDPTGRDREPPGERPRRAADRLDAHRRRVGTAPSRGPPGNSTRSTVMPSGVTARSMATSPEWSRPALAPGVSTRPATRDSLIGPSLPGGIVDVPVGTPRARRRLDRARSAARSERVAGGGGRAPAGRQGRSGVSRRVRRIATAAWRTGCSARARCRARRGRSPGDRGDRPDGTDPGPRSGPRPGARTAARRPVLALGWGLLVDRCLPRGSRTVARRRRVLRCPPQPAVEALRARRCRASGRRKARRAAPARGTRPRARRPVVGQRAVRGRWQIVAHRPFGPRGSPRGGPGHARPLRPGAPTACSAPTWRRIR